VLTGADARPSRLGRRLQDWPVLAWDRVRFVGDRVAAVAADTLAEAEAAVRAIEVEYEELPAVLTPEEALADGAPVLHEDRDEHRYLGGTRPAVPHPNVQGHRVHEHGDTAAGFAGATHVFEHEFQLPSTHQAPIEPRASLVWREGGTLHVATTNKAPFALREQLAASLGIPEERIVVDAGYIGGDFGGKGLSIDEFALVLLVRATGRPVKAVTRYADELQATSVRHSARIRVRTAVDGDGRFLAHEARVVLNGGAYAASKPVPHLLPGDALFTLAGYRVPAARVEAMTVYTNTVPAGHVRAPGQPQNAFAVESHVDLIARALGIDPLELRLRNALRAGDLDVLGETARGSQAVAVLEQLREASGRDRPLGPGRGRGVAIGARHVGRGRAEVVLGLAGDGTVEVITAVSDQGGGAHTMIQRVVAAELGVPPELVRVRRVTTADGPLDPGVGGSRVTPVHGTAAQDGARKLRTRIEELAGTSGGFSELVRRIPSRGDVRVVGHGSSSGYDHGICGYAVEVEVDRETGQVRVVDVTLVADVGTVINPIALRGQLEGGFVFGLGQTLMEELRIEDGRVVEPSLGGYKIPTIADVPPLRVVLVTEGKGPGPFGAKSVGELANPAIGPAVANAVHDAVGARVTSLPITAEKVWRALRRG
ncbi:MAG: xanthine dehydrogenase family protein molybdopterin-binding subunit, partial [Candidatus Limnocylindria bacterium]